MPHPLFDAARQFRAELAAGSDAASRAMLDTYSGIARRLDERLTKLLADLGDTPTAAQLFENNRLESLLAQCGDELNRFARNSAGTVTELQGAAVELAQRHARELTRISLGDPPPGVGPTWTQLDARKLENLVGFTREGAPVGEELSKLVPDGVQRVRDALVSGVGAGQSAAQIAGEVRDVLGNNAARFLTVARTAEMQAYRQAQHEAFQANDDVIGGWIWWASLSADTCAFCLSMHGTRHELHETLDSHFNCRCQQVPSVKSGLPAPPVIETGEEWLKRQSEEVQLRALGPGKFNAWTEGHITLADLRAHDEVANWGRMGREASLRQALERAENSS